MFQRLTSLFDRSERRAATTRPAADFSRLALIAKHTSNAVNILDARGNIEWVNDGFVRMTGYSFEEAKGRVPGSFLRCERTDLVAAEEIDAAIREGRSIRRELVNRGKSGREYWLDIEIVPLFGSDGTLTGFMAIETDISEAKFLQQALTDRNSDLELMSEMAHVGSWHIDAARRSAWWSREVYRIHEVADHYVPTIANFTRFFQHDARQKLDELIQSSIENGARWDIELPLFTAQHREIWIRAQGRPSMELGKITGVAGAFQDISSMVAARDELHRIRERLELATVSANVGLWDWHSADARTWISANWWKHLGYAADQLPETLAAVEEPIHPGDAERVAGEWLQFTNGSAERFLCEFRLRDANGGWRWVQSTGRTTKRNRSGAAERASGVFIDIHQRKLDEQARARDQEHLWTLANIDNLTKVPNRGLFFTELDKAISAAAESRSSLVVGIVDLDRFKEVNDSFGHAIGDELLVKIAKRLSGAVADGDMVARLSGDEFAFFLADVADGARAEAQVRKLLASICDPVDLSNQVRRGGGSIGVARYPADGSSAKDLLRRADIALYVVKSGGRHDFCWFKRPMEEQATKGQDIRQHFASAIEKGEIRVFYQPVVSADGYSVAGFEALARWTAPGRASIQPLEFVLALREPEAALLLATRVRELVLGQIAEWRLKGVPFGRISTNALAADFSGGALAQALLKTLASGALQPGELCVELAEDLLIDAADGSVREDLSMLQRAGVEIALDGFGAGVGSLAQLRDYPIDRIKMHPSLVTALPGTRRDLAPLRAAAALAEALGLRFTADGVETEEQAELVRGFGATELQGQLFGKAMHPLRVPAFLSRFRAGAEVRRSEAPGAADGKVTRLASRRA